ncbi:MAG: HEAT repeat domain-containing protein [Candidatus Riflebacteria bacterium]|nr:HEAT repeat domain-containing protein [Candidatus Riflebacteria bacterium]
MKILRDSRLSGRILIFITALAISSFAYYFTAAEIEEVETRYDNRRVMLVKMLAREINDLINRHLDLSPRLSNLLAEEAIAYAAVQQSDGALLARAENYSMPVEVLEKIEEEAIKTPHLILIPFKDTSRTVSLVEAAIPIIAETGKKVILRVGFFKEAEESRVSQVRFRNTLLFSLALLALATYWFVRKHHASNLQHTLLGGSALLILLLFMASRVTLHSWYEQNWRESFVRHALYVSKMLVPSALRFIDTGEDKDLRESSRIVSTDDGFASIALIRDEQIIFHSDQSLVGASSAEDQNYLKSLNTDQPVIFKLAEENMFEAMIPVLNGRLRVGTLKVGLRSSNRYEPLSIIRDRLALLFLVALILMIFFMHLVSRRISKEISWFIQAMEQATAGDLRQNIYIERNDEFGQLAHAFNFMIMSMKERDMVGRGLQQYVSRSIVERTLKALSGHEKNGEKLFAASIFLYFSGIDEAISRVEGSRIFSGVQECYASLRRIAQLGQNVSIQMFPSGILVLFTFPSRHDSLLKSLNVARLAARDLGRRQDLPFSPKLTMHAMEMIRGQGVDNEEALTLIGDGFGDFRTLARVQDSDEVLASLEIDILLKDVLNFDELEVLSTEQGRMNAYVVGNFKELSELVGIFPTATSWTKIMVLRILKASTEQVAAETLFEWYKDADADVRYHVMDVIERIVADKARGFVESAVNTEIDSRVLSRAIAVLGKVGNEDHIAVLTEKLRSSDRRVKANAVEALEAIGGKRVYEFLNLLVDEQDNRVKANILIALGKYGDLKVFELLSRMIKDPENNMRASAAYALGQLGMAQGVEPLISALSDKDPTVRRQVVASLTALKADLDIEV